VRCANPIIRYIHKREVPNDRQEFKNLQSVIEVVYRIAVLLLAKIWVTGWLINLFFLL